MLKLLQKFTLFGNVESVGVVPFMLPTETRAGAGPHSERDTLLLSFQHAKLSLVRFNPASQGLETLCILNFEASATGLGARIKADSYGYENFASWGLTGRPQIAVDFHPLPRCAVMLVHGLHLAVLTFRRGRSMPKSEGSSAAIEQAEAEGDDGQFQNDFLQEPQLLSLKDDLQIDGFVKDMAFLDKYIEPTLLVLHEARRSNIGRAAIDSGVCQLTAISFSLTTKQHTIVWKVEKVPADSLKIQPVPKPTGGAVLLSANSAIYFDQHQNVGLALNSYAKATTDMKFRLSKNPTCKLGVSLGAVRHAFLGGVGRGASHDVKQKHILLSLHSGELWQLLLHTAGTQGEAVTSMSMERLESREQQMTTLCAFPRSSAITVGSKSYGLVLMASRLGPSTLLGYSAVTATAAIAGGNALSSASLSGALHGSSFTLADASASKKMPRASPSPALGSSAKFDAGSSESSEGPPAKRVKTEGADDGAKTAVVAGTMDDDSDDDAFLYGSGNEDDTTKQDAELPAKTTTDDDPFADSDDSDESDEPLPMAVESSEGQKDPMSPLPVLKKAAEPPVPDLSKPSLELMRMDRLDFAGPNVDLVDAFSPPPKELALGDIKSWKPAYPEGVACTGLAHSGAMTTWHQGVRGRQLARVEDAPNVVGVWSVGGGGEGGRSFVFLSEPERTRVKMADGSSSTGVTMADPVNDLGGAFQLEEATIVAGEMFGPVVTSGHNLREDQGEMGAAHHRHRRIVQVLGYRY